MRNLKFSRSSTMLEAQRRVPLNTVVLPPLSPTLSESGAQYLGQILVNKTKSGGVNGELVAVARPADFSNKSTETNNRGPDASRVAQLEQNVRFLQEQHQLMLTGLHHEIDSLRHRNRELQFQLVFAKGSVPSSPSSSSEDDSKHKVYTSPKQVNAAPLQVELLERELSELKIHMQDVESRNVYLSAIVDEQKKKLERYERDRERERERAMQPDPELLRKLDDAESMIRRLRHENTDLRRESSASLVHSSGMSYQQAKDGGNYHGGRENGSSYQGQKSGANQGRGMSRNRGNGHYRGGNWFPPLHSQSYWQGGRSIDRGNGGIVGDGTSLPSLQNSGGNGGNSSQYHSRRGSNNNHYHNDDIERCLAMRKTDCYSHKPVTVENC